MKAEQNTKPKVAGENNSRNAPILIKGTEYEWKEIKVICSGKEIKGIIPMNFKK